MLEVTEQELALQESSKSPSFGDYGTIALLLSAAHGWRQAETADSLRIDRKTLWRKIREWGLEPPP